MSIPASDNPVSRFSGTRVTLVQTNTGPTTGVRTAGMLRNRLRAVVGLLAGALVLWIGRGMLEPGSHYVLVQGIALATATVVGVAVTANDTWRRLHLRAMEIALFAIVAACLSVHGYLVLADRAAAGDALHAQAHVYNTAIAISAMILLHGMLIPSTWRGSLALMGPMAIAALLPGVMLRVLRPDAYMRVADVFDLGTALDIGMALGAALLVGASGTQMLYSLRRQVIEANDLGQYQLQERIAVGGMGEIWRASHRFLARPAAVKVIHPDRIDPLDRESARRVLERFEVEAQATAALESLHTVRIYDFGSTQQGDFYYAMELLNGLDLERLVTRFGPLAPERTIHLLLQACDSLAEAHDLGQVHRDIKPSNLFCCRIGRAFDVIKVLDFGLVTRAGSEPSRDLRLDDDEGLAGTPAYMAPEQVLAVTKIDERTDLYSLGCVAYWMLTGHTVFDIDRPIAMAVAHVKAPPLPPSRRTELPIPRDLERIIMRCLAKDPARRPASAGALADLLLACSTAGTWTPQDARDWWERHRPLEGAAPIESETVEASAV